MFNPILSIDSPVARWEKKRSTAAPVAVAKPVSRPPIKNSKHSVRVSEAPRKVIWTVGSPVRENGKDGPETKTDEQSGAFFETCFLCKKKITQKNDVFMYGYLRAFCSSECREKQIIVDEKGKPASSESLKMAVKKDVSRRGFNPNYRMTPIARFK